MKKVHAILTADWHLREDIPTCRTDDFEETQWRKVKYISDLQKKYRCPVIHSGDLFDYWKPSPALLSKAIENLPSQFYSIYGNHDLPQHNIELASKSGLHCLVKAGVVKLLHHQGDWNYQEEELKPSPILSETYPLLVLHTMTYQGALPYPGCKDLKSIALLRKYPDAQLILTGHNHKPFVEEWEGRRLINPGSITRQSAADTWHPRVYLLDIENNEVEAHMIPIDADVITREHIDAVEERDNRIEAFISTLQEDFEVSLDFEKNLQQFIAENTIKPKVEEIIMQSIGK